jgi:hypothetical protein
MTTPDRSEFFWAQANGKGKGPAPLAPSLGERRVDYHELSMYTETATGPAGAFVSIPYRALHPEDTAQAVGFADMNVGTKALIFDCELLQIAFQFKTYIPIGNFHKGLGTGHVSLEPGLLLTLKLADDTYFQGQLSEWIPIGGTPGYAGAVLLFRNSVNHVFWRPTSNIQLIGNVELDGWGFQTGSFTDPITGTPQRASGTTYLSMGPGVRLVICDKYDFGFASEFALTQGRIAEEIYHLDFRVRF